MGSLNVVLGEASVQVLRPLFFFFNWFACPPGVKLCEFFIYLGYQTLLEDIIGKYVFPYGWFLFHFLEINLLTLAMQKLFSLM